MKLKNWSIISGKNGNVDDGKLIYIPRNEDEEFCCFRTDKYFHEGEISFKAKIEDSYTSMGIEHKVRKNNGDISTMKIGHAKKGKAFTVTSDEIKESSSSLENYDLTKEIYFLLKFKGSNISFYVNNIEILKTSANLVEEQITFFISSKGKVEVYDIEVVSKMLTGFVIMQFSEDYNELYSQVIKPICQEKNIECVRADDMYNSTPILNDITENIKNSSLIIAEITPDNPNVYYEIGYSHAINKPTILLCNRTREKLPFDISGFRTIFYSNTIIGKKKVEDDLRRFIDNIFRTTA
jgi:hypothetical protein